MPWLELSAFAAHDDGLASSLVEPILRAWLTERGYLAKPAGG